MHLALQDLFRAKWTGEIHEEWITALLQQRPDLTRDKLERTRDMMNEHVRDCLVTGHMSLCPSLTLPDPDDRHVLAAAIVCRADVIVTTNLKDFPAGCLSPFGIEAQHPDDFIMHLFDLEPGAVCEAAQAQRASLKNPPKSVEEFLEGLQRQQLLRTVQELRKYSGLL